MLTQVLILILGLALIVFGADYLVDGASSIARKAGISEFVIGLTIVGMGTSAPEMVVSFMGALQGNADIAVGNIVGSNIFNVLMILGITAVMMPIGITPGNKKKDIPVNIFVTLLLITLGLNATIFGLGTNVLSRFDGAVLLTCFVAYLAYAFHEGKKEGDTAPAENEKSLKLWVSIIFVIGGLAALVAGGKMFVNSATAIAKMLRVSDKFIAITILAGGTSLPELATCVAAAMKKKGQLALGNILGSNVFNILLILGGSALITPLSFEDIGVVDLCALLLSGLLIWTSAYTGERDKIDRADGVIMLFCEAAYFVWLLIQL